MDEIKSLSELPNLLWQARPTILTNSKDIDFCLAFSGGLDSSVLLSILSDWHTLGEIQHCRAIHINHGLSPHASEWEAFCQRTCDDYKIPLEIVRLQSAPEKGESIEAWARAQRLAVFKQKMDPHTVLLTAHQQNDQAETFLLNALRGSGVAGLSAMPNWQSFALGYQWRPILHLPRTVIADYARLNQIHYVEDESNESERFNRNYLRQVLWPQLTQRWPRLSQTLARTAKHCAETLELVHALAQHDLECCSAEQNHFSIQQWKTLSSARRRNLILYFLKTLNLDLPNEKKLKELERQLITARSPLKLAVRWQQTWARAYRDRIHFFKQLPAVPLNYESEWDGNTPLALPAGVGYLKAEPSLVGKKFQVRFRRSGDCMIIPGRGTHSLKNIFQEAGIPPWQRSRIPLIFHEGKIIAIPGIMQCSARRFTIEID